ncbi:hypothetical protein GSI_01319 [Ganoderma sinense ZZ0214-1]|uniref:Uncharacterized protein n=1 Tax=Ganoderma sinense ZZ0214-1 TaxID=1077348 RepID=A0A2G8SV25_9APHY|nr:hypothetical protein GSI_01319 [Ganoderma sinense ZZ0214-1]
MALSKKALAKSGPRGHKLVFDDAGDAHEVYELKDAGEVFVGGKEEVMEAGRRFAESERGKLRAADVEDKAEAKEKKREKKRKRKEREREGEGYEDDGDGGGFGAAPVVADYSDDDGYASPKFDLPPGSEDESEPERPPTKKSRTKGTPTQSSLEADEELALKMLRRGR